MIGRDEATAVVADSALIYMARMKNLFISLATILVPLQALIGDGDRPGTLAHSVRALLDCAYAVRDQLSGDTWLIVGPLERAISEVGRPGGAI